VSGLTSIPEADHELHFQALEAVVRAQLHIVWIDLNNRDNAQVIFETLNDRGAPLNAIDLVKDLVFQHQHGGDEAEELYEQYWAWIEDDWWQQKIRLGRLDRVQADVFLQHWLQMRLAKEVNSDYLFKSFAKMLEAEAPDVKALIPQFAEDAQLYRSFSSQPHGTRRREFFDRLHTLNTTTPFPLVLLLFKQPTTVLSAEDIDHCLTTIEDYLIRRMLLRGTAQGYNRLFTELVRDVKQAPSSAPETIEQYLVSAEGASRRWPRDADLLPVLTESRAYGSGAIARHRLLDVLWEVESRRMRTAKHENLDRPSGLQIEHVMPQSWKKSWPLPTDDDGPAEILEARRKIAINKLGNLTLVTEKLNPALSNADWQTKRKGLAQHSLLEMNQRLVESYASGFDETQSPTGANSSRGIFWPSGEIFALHRPDVHMDKQMIHVRWQLDLITGDITWPKDDDGRWVPMSPALHAYFERMPRMGKVVDSKLGEIVFPSVRGGYMRRSQWSSLWNAIRVAAGMPGQDFYELKHRAIQWMVDPIADGGLGLDPATAAEIVGHDDGGYLIATVYTKLGQRRALARAQRAMTAYQQRRDGEPPRLEVVGAAA
jgi:hypothetical protein